MWIRSQNLQEILEVKHIRILPLDDGTVNILAKLDRETILLGTYGKKQAESLAEDIMWETTHGTSVMVMPEREEEKK